MSKSIDRERFTKEFFELLDETFETQHGIYLDRDTSLFATLETVSAAEASIPVGGKCATLAAQVAHITLHLEVLEGSLLNKDLDNVDWGEVWRRVGQVSPEEWSALKRGLRQTYQRVWELLHGIDDWNEERPMGGALAVAVHTAYHLGEIRQALCNLK